MNHKRSEQEMFDLILGTAQEDARVRAVLMNGSRANPNAPRDIFQDFDIVYIVTDVESFKSDPTWISRFGELMILQLPDDMHDPPPLDQPGYTYLMQFLDGSRIDLNLFPLRQLKRLEEDSQTILLLDKDGLFPPFPPPSDRSVLPKPPSAKAYADCCNEFWWVNPYVAKGLWREEILYAKYMLEQVLRPELLKMLVWYIGAQTDFEKNPGKYGKYFQKHLAPQEWELLLQTYTGAGYEETWQALFRMGELFRQAARQVGGWFGYEYPTGDDERVSVYLQQV